MARRRWQGGRLFLRGKRTKVWVGSWREDVVDSVGQVTRVRRSAVLGTIAEFPTRKLARRRLDLLLAHVNSPSYRPGRVASLAEFVERWREHILTTRKPSTAKAAESHLRCYIIPKLGMVRLEQITQETVQQFVSHLSSRVSRHTTLNVLATLGSILKAARSWGYFCGSFDSAALAIPFENRKRQARFFTAEEASAILAACQQEPFRTMFAMAAMTGVRPGELCGFSVDDLDLEQKLIHVRTSAWYGKLQTPKSRASSKALPLPAPLEARLRTYLRTWKPNPLRLLFANRAGKPFFANSIVQRKLWPILDKLGIPRCGLHAFRHTHSSLLLAEGASPTVAQAQLRHSDPRITLGIYGHVLGDAQRQAVEKVAAILEPNGAKLVQSSEWVQ